MKKLKSYLKKVVNFSLSLTPITQDFLRILSKLINLAQGKGWGSSTIRQEIKACLKLLNRTPRIFIDVGANKGLYSIEIKKLYPGLEMHIFEPSKLNCKILVEKLSENKETYINSLALAEKAEKRSLYSDHEGSGNASLTKRNLDHFSINFNFSEEINTIRFDEYWEKYNKLENIDYVKIDVEGHELSVLKGFGDYLFKTKIIQFEFGGCNIDTRSFFQDFWYFFQEKGFKIFRITPKGPKLIKKYSEYDEFFVTTNYIAVNQNIY